MSPTARKIVSALISILGVSWVLFYEITEEFADLPFSLLLCAGCGWMFGRFAAMDYIRFSNRGWDTPLESIVGTFLSLEFVVWTMWMCREFELGVSTSLIAIFLAAVWELQATYKVLHNE